MPIIARVSTGEMALMANAIAQEVDDIIDTVSIRKKNFPISESKPIVRGGITHTLVHKYVAMCYSCNMGTSDMYT